MYELGLDLNNCFFLYVHIGMHYKPADIVLNSEHVNYQFFYNKQNGRFEFAEIIIALEDSVFEDIFSFILIFMLIQQIVYTRQHNKVYQFIGKKY